MFDQLLGFDMRLAFQRYLPLQWSADRRGKYLINPSVSWPLSVDKLVWPTIFTYDDTTETSAADLSVHMEPRDEHQDALELWSNPADMYRAAEAAPASSDAVPIAVRVFSRQPLTDVDYWRAVLDETYVPTPIDPAWVCVGYDVADCYRLSGLSNCAYTEREKFSIIHKWASDLDEFGLFRDPATALAFADATDRRVPEHAPFFAYGIYSERKRLNLLCG